MRRGFLLAFLAAVMAAGETAAAEPGGPALRLVIEGAPHFVFIPSRDSCDSADVPDAPLRAFSNAAGEIVAFGMHDVNRAFRGPTLGRLKLDCRVVFSSGHDPDPAHYDDHNWIAATWTRDDRSVDALVRRVRIETARGEQR